MHKIFYTKFRENTEILKDTLGAFSLDVFALDLTGPSLFQFTTQGVEQTLEGNEEIVEALVGAQLIDPSLGEKLLAPKNRGNLAKGVSAGSPATVQWLQAQGVQLMVPAAPEEVAATADEDVPF
jgi:hypothetical protein